MSDSEARLEFVGQLGEDFVARFRRGERPAVSEYTDRHPQYADEIRELFPALVMMEDVVPSGPGGDNRAATVQRPVALSRLGDYRIVREVGRGGMGIVYEAEQVSLGRHVALKVLPQQMLDARHKQRFEREAKAAARLHHTNIVPVFGVGEHEGLSYYVMQFIQGLGLDAVLDELKRLKAADRSASNLATAAEELRVSRRCDVSATDVARSLIERSFVVQLAADAGDAVTGNSAAGPFAATAVDDTIDSQTLPSRRDDPAALTEPGSLATSLRSDTATGKLSDTFALSGSVVLPGGQSAAEADAQRPRQTYWQSVAHIGIQIASALQYAHDQGILHRDIKPGNLLLDLRGTVWVTDFGLAKSSDQPDITRTGDVLGTLRYMPPEAFEGNMDPRSDVYSLGLTLYELLALKPAFDDRDRHKLIKQMTTAEAPALEKLNSEIPRDLATIVHKAIDRDTARRYQTAFELQADLARFLADEPVQARPLSLRERGWRWCRRNPSVAVLSAVVILGFAAVSAATTLAYFRELAHSREIENKNTEIIEALRRETALKSAEREARDEATGQLYRSLVDQARANRLSRRIGQRVTSLEVLAKAVRMAREMSLPENDFLELRNEAIACLVLPDIRLGRELSVLPVAGQWVDFNGPLDRYVRVGRDGMVSLRLTENDTEICNFPGLGPGDPTPLLSPDGRFLTVWNWNREGIKVWKLDGADPVLIFGDEKANCPTFSPDSRYLACRIAGESILIVDLDSTGIDSTGIESGKRLRQFPVGSRSERMAWHPAGRLLAISDAEGVQIRNAETGMLEMQLPQPRGTYFVAWHPDGRTLAAVNRDSLIQIWDVASRTPTVQFKATNAGIHFEFSHSGNLLASNGWDGVLRMWDPRTGELMIQSPMYMPVPRPRFSADDRLLAASALEPGRQIRLVEIFPACCYRTLVRDPVLGRGLYYGISVSRDDRLLAVGMSDGVALWDLRSGRPLTFLPCGLNYAVRFEPSGGLLMQERAGVVRRPIDIDAAAPGTVRIGAPQLLPLDDTSGRLAGTRHGSVVAKTMGWGVIVWQKDTAMPALRLRHDDARGVAVSPDGSQVATAAYSGAGVRIWNASTGELVREFPADRNVGVEFSPDARWLAATIGRLWATDTWTEIRSFEPCSTLAFSPDSQILAMEMGKGIVRLVDPESGREYARLDDPHQDRALSLCFSHDSAQLVVTTEDSSAIHVWNLPAIRQELRNLGLDWDLPPYPPADAQPDAPPLVAVEVLPAEEARPAETAAAPDVAAYAASTMQTYRSAFEATPGEVSFGRGWATLALDSGDIAEYKRACEQLRDRFGTSDNWFHQVHVCWSFMLADDSVADKKFLLSLGENLVALRSDLPWTHTSLAAVLLRNGQHEAALRSLDESDRLEENWHAHVTNDFLRAIALVRLERIDEARATFDKGAAHADSQLVRTTAAPFGEIPANHSLDWYAIRILRREATALLAAAVSGKKAATDVPAPADTP